MPNHIMFVLSNATPGMEDEFNDWYSKVHVIDTVDKLKGFESGRRYRLSGEQVEGGSEFRYLAIYAIPESRLEEAQTAIRYQRQERADALVNGRTPYNTVRTELFGGPHHSYFFTECDDLYVGDADSGRAEQADK